MSSDLEQLQAQLDAIQVEIAHASATSNPGPVAVSAGDGGAIAYQVCPGDTLATIAAAFDTTPDALMAANVGTLIDPDSLIIGQRIALPGAEG